MKPTPEQAAFIASMREGNSIALKAVAGSGKTTTLLLGLDETLRAKPALSVLLCAFNKRNAEDFAEKLDGFSCPKENLQIATLNALGHRTWMSHTKKKINLNSRKIWDLIKERIPYEKSKQMPDLSRLIDFARLWPMVPPGAINGPKDWNPTLLADFAEESDLDLGPFDFPTILDYVKAILAEDIRRGWLGEIDFNDQLYLPVSQGAAFRKFDLVIVDEAQDLNGIQQEMLARSLKPGGQFVAAGDERQAIYAFRGADARSFHTLGSRFDLMPLPLTFSFRCPKAVVREAVKIVPEIRSTPDAPEGEVLRGTIKDIPPGSAVVSRYNAPLIPLAFAFIRAGQAATILGAEIGKSLAKLVTQNAGETLEETLAKVKAHCNLEAQRALDKSKEDLSSRWAEKYELIDAIAYYSKAKSAYDIERHILHLFSNEKSIITLSTIHKAKGMEWDTVGFIAPDAIPDRRARARGGVALVQELNAKYVGLTRAKKRLVILPQPEKE